MQKANIKLSHLHHWKTLPYKKIPNFQEFYYEEKDNQPYFSDWDKSLKYLAAMGYDGVEILPWDLREISAVFGSIQAFREAVEAYGLKVSGMFVGIDDSRFAEKRAELVSQAENSIKDIQALGGENMILSPESEWYKTGGLTDEQVGNIAECLNEIGRRAEGCGIHVAIHTEFHCAINMENHRQLLEKTDPRYVHHCLDTAPIAMMGEDIAKFYADYHDRICAIHLKDTADVGLPDELRHSNVGMIPDDGHRWFWEPGEGLLDFPALWKQLKKYNFKGWVSVETDGTPDLLASMALASYYVHQELAKIYA